MFKYISLTLALIPGLAFTNHQSAHSDYKEIERAPRVAESSSMPASRSYAIGVLPSNQAEPKKEDESDRESKQPEPLPQKAGWWLVVGQRPNKGIAFYKQRAEAIVAGALEYCEFLKSEEANKIAQQIKGDLEDIALFEAAECGDIEAVKALKGENSSIGTCDKRTQYLNIAKHIERERDFAERPSSLTAEFYHEMRNFVSGFDLETRIAARGDKELLETLMAHGKKHGNQCFWAARELKPEMVDLDAEINSLGIATFAQSEHQRVHNDAIGNTPLAEFIRFGKTQKWNRLATAAVAGHVDVVDLLLSAWLPAQHSFYQLSEILVALENLVMYSNTAKTDLVNPLLNSVGINQKPKCENYPIIARKLLKIYFGLQDDISREHLQLDKQEKELFEKALPIASPEICQLIIESFADKINSSADVAFSFAWENHLEKACVLLSAQAHPESLVYKAKSKLLEWLPQAGRELILSRLKRYVREHYNAHQQETNHELEIYLPSALSNIVNDHLLFMPVEMKERILAIPEE